mmetsp:Transcript_48190/g.95509  ORF Transcript_48190/g.95509 Transcript_48190/m.95509 type:complete len:1029 (+) Transcript_48190:70-3156(+)
MSKSCKAAEAQEAVRKRKVNPIYEQLDNQNWKGAVKLCQKKDIADWDIVLALKAHALERLGSTDEALDLCRLVKERKPTEGGVLSALSMTFKLMDMGDEATESYENALALEPANVEMTQEVFFSHCRSFNFSKQQQFAMKLFKQIPSPHFIMWSATSMLLHVRSPAGAGAKSMLTLSERMVKRTLDGRAEKGARPSAEEQRLYLALLREQGKFEEALGAVIAHGAGEAPLGTKAVSNEAAKIKDEASLEATGVPSEFLMMQPQERLELEAELRLSARSDFAGAHGCYSSLLAHAPEQWSYHVGLLDALFAESSQEAWASEAKLLLDRARASALAQQMERPKSRAPYLLELELLRRWGEAPLEGGGQAARGPLPPLWVTEGEEGKAGQEGESAALVCEYVERFSSKPCCFLDLKPYLAALKLGKARGELIAALSSKADDSNAGLTGESSASDTQQRIAQLHKHICCCQCLRFLDATTGEAALTAEVVRLFSLYRATLNVNEGAAGGQREVQHGDELVLLAAHALRDLVGLADLEQDSETRHQRSLDAAALLEYGLTCSPFNYHMKVELLSVYRALGAFEAAVSLFNELKIRHVQVDSLSWLLVPGCAATGLFTEVQKQLREVLRIHRSSRRDAGDYCVKALECGNYTKAVEIAEFQRKRMDLSLQLHSARVDLCGLELLLVKHSVEDALPYLDDVAAPDAQPCSKAAPEALRRNSQSKSESHAFSVNHDWTVRLSWDDKPFPTSEATRMEHRAVVGTATLRLLHLCLTGGRDELATQLAASRHLFKGPGASSPSSSSAAAAAAAAGEAAEASVQSAKGENEKLSADEVEAMALKLSLHMFEGSLELMNTGEGASDEKPLLRSIATLHALHAALVSRAPEGPASPFTAGWLESVCRFLDTVASTACLILQAWVAKIAPKKGKGKKGKAASATVSVPLVGGVRLAHAAMAGLLSGLSACLKTNLAANTEAAEASSLPKLSAIFDLVTDTAFQETRGKLVSSISSSQRLSSARLSLLVKRKLESIGVLPVEA